MQQVYWFSGCDELECHDVVELLDHSDAWSSGNESQEMAKDIILFHGRDNNQPYNESEQLVDHVINRIYNLALDRACDKNFAISKAFGVVESSVDGSTSNTIFKACVDSVNKLWNDYDAEIASYDKELSL